MAVEVDDRSVRIATTVCAIAGQYDLISDVSSGLRISGLVDAVRRHDDEVLCEWLAEVMSFQGISDANAVAYIEQHGRIRTRAIADDFAKGPSCPKLASYWSFEGCRYHKASRSCAEPVHISGCPVPRHDLRKGGLNEGAFALYLFFRDVSGGDFVSWVDNRLGAAASIDAAERRPALREALLGALSNIHGLSRKILSMALSDLLLGAGADRPLWMETGASLVAIDSLVHNWLHRTGIVGRLGAPHPYGPRCYGAGGCAELVDALSAVIDARRFNPRFPRDFPRFVQKSIWWFCAQAGQAECNGNRIDDRIGCDRSDCALGPDCDRRALGVPA